MHVLHYTADNCDHCILKLGSQWVNPVYMHCGFLFYLSAAPGVAGGGSREDSPLFEAKVKQIVSMGIPEVGCCTCTVYMCMSVAPESKHPGV